MSARSRVERIRARLGHPVVDADGHTIEYLPAVRDDLQALAGRRAVAQLDAVLGFAQAARALSFAVALSAGVNPDFFAGTVIEAAAGVRP
jgi:hypothetical protein